jgi:hypothetical protein
MRVRLANLLWLLSCLPGWLAFLCAARNVKRTQARVLARTLARNASTEFGQRHRFAKIRNPDAFQAVPLSDYEDYAAPIAAIRAGQTAVLTHDPVVLLQPTSGSTAATKLIPYTRALQREFQAAIDPWIAALYLAYPGLLLGRHYWSISPATPASAVPAGGVRVGFADDAEYLGVIQRFVARVLFAVPWEITQVRDPDVFAYLTVLFLLREKNLRLISVWHPSYLTLLTQAAATHLLAVAHDLETGTIAASIELPPDLRRTLNARLGAHPARAQELRAADRNRIDLPGCLWPRLRVISCWTEGRAEPWLSELRRQFPRVVIQGKGLTATEGIVSFPLGNSQRNVCAIRSHYVEFCDAATGNIRRAWEVQPGGEYSVILTTGGGLYRYRLHDLVRITGFYHRAPCLEFLSRNNLVSDLVGEKLNSRHVEESIRKVEDGRGVEFAFAMVAPVLAAQTAGYVFFVQTEGTDTDCRRVGALLEDELNRNFHYRHARELSQLQTLRTFQVTGDAAAVYRQFLVQKGTRTGDIKFNALSSNTGWDSVFNGKYIT